MDGRSLYETDFALWSRTQADAIRQAAASGANLPLDWENLAEEIEDLGGSVRRELDSRLGTIVEHMLKLRLSRAQDPRPGWRETIGRERLEIEGLLERNPSLRSGLAESLKIADRRGRKLAKLGLERHFEWSRDVERRMNAVAFTADDVLGPALPDEPA